MPIHDDGYLDSQDYNLIEAIFRSLGKYGIPESDISTNGYNFDFDYGSLHVHFCVQSERLVGEIRRNSIAEESMDEVNRGLKLCDIDENPIEWAKYVKNYDLRNFCFWGGLEIVDRVMELAKVPIEKYVADKIEERLNIKAAAEAGTEIAMNRRLGNIADTQDTEELFKEIYEKYFSSKEFAKLRNDVVVM